MSVSIESMESRTLFSSAALIQLRADAATYKIELTTVKKTLTAEVKTIMADLKRVKAPHTDTILLAKTLASNETIPTTQLTAAINSLVSKAAAYVPAAATYSVRITAATTARYDKTLGALNAAFTKEDGLSDGLCDDRLEELSSSVMGIAATLGDATTVANAATLASTSATADTELDGTQATVQADINGIEGVVTVHAL